MRTCLIAIAGFAYALAPQSACALKYNVPLYQPEEIARHGISVVVQETKTGALKCTLTFDPQRIKVSSVELFSSLENAKVSVPVQLQEIGSGKMCHFTLSPDLMMHGSIEIAVVGNIPGGMFYNIALIDMIDFRRELPPSLARRRAAIIDLIVQKKLARYEDSTPPRRVEETLEEFLKGRTPVTPYKSNVE